MIIQWKTIDGHPLYEVSNTGLVQSTAKGLGKLLKPRPQGRDTKYLWVVLIGGPKPKAFSVHSLVAHHFIGPRTDGLEINHMDRNTFNNFVDNLEYVTPSQNVQHSYDTGRESRAGIMNPAAILTEADVIEIRSSYQRGKKEFCQTALARRFQVSQGCIWRILERRTWKEV